MISLTISWLKAVFLQAFLLLVISMTCTIYCEYQNLQVEKEEPNR